MYEQKIPRGGGISVTGTNRLVPSGRFADPSRLDTIRADRDSPHVSLNDSPDALQVRQESSGSSVVCVADVIARHGFLSANCTNPCHSILRILDQRIKTR
jgi:hypothetical protein